MDHQRTVFLVGGGTGGYEQAVFTLHVNGAACNLKCSYRDKVIEAEEEDFFEALFKSVRHSKSMACYPSVTEQAPMFIRKIP